MLKHLFLAISLCAAGHTAAAEWQHTNPDFDRTGQVTLKTLSGVTSQLSNTGQQGLQSSASPTVLSINTSGVVDIPAAALMFVLWNNGGSSADATHIYAYFPGKGFSFFNKSEFDAIYSYQTAPAAQETYKYTSLINSAVPPGWDSSSIVSPVWTCAGPFVSESNSDSNHSSNCWNGTLHMEDTDVTLSVTNGMTFARYSSTGCYLTQYIKLSSERGVAEQVNLGGYVSCTNSQIDTHVSITKYVTDDRGLVLLQTPGWRIVQNGQFGNYMYNRGTGMKLIASLNGGAESLDLPVELGSSNQVISSILQVKNIQSILPPPPPPLEWRGLQPCQSLA